MSGHPRLRRELGLFDAVMLGLGAMIGTGVFVSIGLGAGLVGPAVVVALMLAAGVALCSGLSSAQLAAAHPVSGGTYEYGYQYLSSWAGFTAGWVFLVAKSASAATAALGLAGYSLHAFGASAAHRVPLALAATVALTAVVLSGIRRSSRANLVIVSITLIALLYFIGAGLPQIDWAHLRPFFATGAGGSLEVARLLEATAIMFVAYAGYARIATLGEEIRDPERTIPAAIVVSALVVMLLYAAVAIVAIGVIGPRELLAATEQAAAPLAVVAQRFALPLSEQVLMIGAVTAMLGVLLNLLLGLSRVVFAMARRGDLFAVLGRVDASGATPYWAVLAVAAGIGGLVTIGDIRTTWSFSAFAVLVYYSLTNLAAWRMAAAERRYPRWIAGLGFVSCLSLAFWVERRVWIVGLALIAFGCVWHVVAQRYARPLR